MINKQLTNKAQCCTYLAHLLEDDNDVQNVIDEIWITVSGHYLNHRKWVLGHLAIPNNMIQPEDTKLIEPADYYETAINYLTNRLEEEHWPVEDDIILETASWLTNEWTQ